MWLGRALAAVAGTVFLHWTGMLGGGTHAEGAETWRWTTAHALPHLFLACMAALSARSLLRGEARVEPRTGVVGGALIVLALEGLTLAMIGGDLDELSLSVRTDVLVQTAALAVGIWASSFALRSHRQSVTT